MKDAKQKKKAIIRQLKFQRGEWMREMSADQKDLKNLLFERDKLTATYEAEYDKLTNSMIAKLAEIGEENQPQLIEYNRMIAAAEAEYEAM